MTKKQWRNAAEYAQRLGDSLGAEIERATAVLGHLYDANESLPKRVAVAHAESLVARLTAAQADARDLYWHAGSVASVKAADPSLKPAASPAGFESKAVH